ncbi:hypothetical protein F0M17_14190 [Glutamicibacter sp. ZJUTW]|nr:hypothetical protein F0M17_14190 [Glutamicibacter sp. ZJUTW]
MLLRGTLGEVAPLPETIVVSHFDQDHWKGLESFAQKASKEPGKRIDLIYPRFPSVAKPVQAAYLAYQFLALTTPERSLFDLFKALEDKAAPVRNAGFAGRKFKALDTVWEILWPPKELPNSVSKVFTDAANRTAELAEQYPPLKRALDWAYESPWMLPDEDAGSVFARFEGDDEVFESRPALELDDLPKDTADESYDLFGDATTGPQIFIGNDFAGAPANIRNELISNRRRVQRLNNELSLVIRDENMQFLSFGDLQKWGLNQLLRQGGLKNASGKDQVYSVVLAPHHGTQAPGSTFIKYFPKTQLMIAQNGREHLKRLKWQKFLGGIVGKIESTAEIGTISFCLHCCPAQLPYSWARAWHFGY